MKYVVFFFLFISPTVFAQKELTLETAVMEQYRSFYPERPMGFNWVPNSNDYTYIKGYTSLIKSSVNNEEKTWFTIGEINEMLDAKLRWFSGFEWKNENSFYLNDGKNYYVFCPEKKKGKRIHSLENAENALLHNASGKLAYTVENNVAIAYPTKKGKEKLVQVTDIDDKNIVAGQAIARSEFGISGGLFWSPNGEFLAFYQKDETEVHGYPLLDNSVTPGELKSIKYPMAGQTSEKPKVGVYNLKDEKVVYISPRGNEDDYLTNLTFTPDNKYVVIAEVNRDQNHAWLNVYDAVSGEFVKTLLEEESDTWVEPEHPAYFLENADNEFVWISEKDGFNNLYHYDFNGKLLRKLTENKFVVKNIEKIVDKRIYFSATGENPLNTMLYSVDFKGNQKLHTTAEGMHSNQVSSNGKYIYDGYSNRKKPYFAQILNAKNKPLKTILEAENPLYEYKRGHADIKTITAKDGTELYTRMILPSDFDPRKKYPVLVYVYGGPHAQLINNSWLQGASLWMYWLAEQGYLVFTVDNRGSANRGVDFEKQIHRQLGTIEIEDQMAGIEYLKSLRYVNGNRLAVHGWSFGGFMTSSLMLRKAGTFNVGVAGGPVTDWKYYEVMYGERYMDRPEENEEGYQQASLLTHADKLQDDLLLIHGTVDDVVVMQHNLALVQKFVDLNIQMDFFPYPMHKHNVRGKDRVHLMTKILHYILEKNK